MSARDPFDFESPTPAPDAGRVRVPAARPFDRLRAGAAGPPVGRLLGALVVALVAAAGALLLGDDIGVAVACWALAGPVAIGLVALFVLADTRARSAPLYIRPPWMGALSVLTGLAVAAGIVTSAVRIADWWGRL